ncbi:nicotinamidase Pnc1 [Schizosaccharomyces pombe]|uniref:Nicotinamidase n=1 Tax=Schizosaccharomyces pombe (strain 972 / ATCC 24843) TaxID=284812 RepID=PNC1_SCHPO|nr:putative nicotinamidase Pnc1 [Schizosaccharomyces pombe]Q9USS0.2 RecName: Full=Nicotinamidase; AltName: Full=Nicotinamide deamidase; Short=NAMase [Schizosaccharomyces pombe 972h-]CAB60673.2 nicotinamidase Pnc1 (predicted) [Schizosaccharomyces pombe]|eukprot:NP_596029.2 putative nicotinamidase Pnc1 [Schizosaccharomyces pombe]
MSFHPALIIVDVQNDFVHPVYISSGESALEVVPVINRLLENDYKWDTVIATKDVHPKDHLSFTTSHSSTPKPSGTVVNIEAYGHVYKQTLWNSHCVENTPGCEFPDSLNGDRIEFVIPKGSDRLVESYSGFYDAIGRDNGLKAILDKKGITDVFIAGVATDICVKETALHARHWYNTYIISEAVKGSSTESHNQAIKDFRDAKIEVISEKDPILQSVRKV